MTDRSPFWLGILPGPVRRQLSQRSNLVAIIDNAGWLLADKSVRLLVGFTVGAWVARYLGPAQFGELSYALAFVAFFQGVAALGADGIVVRDIARNPSDAPELLGSLFSLRLGVGLLAWAIAIAGMALLRSDDPELLLLVAIVAGCLVFQPGDVIDLWFQSQSQSRRTVFAKLSSYLATNGVKIVLVAANAPLYAFAVAIALDFAVGALALSIAYRRFPANGRWRWRGRAARSLIRQGFPFMVSGLAITTYVRIDQIMIEAMLGKDALGIFSAAMPLSQAWYMIAVTLSTTLAPFMARKGIVDDPAYEKAMVNVFRIFLALALTIAVATAILAPWLVEILYGRIYEKSADVLQIHVFTNVFVFLGVAQNMWAVSEGLGYLTLKKAAFGAVASVAANFVLIPQYGVVGAAVAALLSVAIADCFVLPLLAPSLFRIMKNSLLPRILWTH